MDGNTNQTLSPEIVLANNARFEGAREVYSASVESRMCLWSKGGRGEIVVNGRRLPVRPFDYFVLPWRQSIRYQPDPTAPFYLAGIHLIPWHNPAVELEWGVAHDVGHPLYGVTHRQDRLIEGAESLVHRHLSHDHALLQLSEYIVQRAARAHSDRRQMQRCAYMLLDEIHHTVAAAPTLPQQLRQLEHFIDRNMSRPLGVTDLATHIDRSPSQVARLCRQHLGRTPGAWIAAVKMASSCEQLRTTRQSIAEIARQAGYDDQFHFSRVFKRHLGLSPLKFRQQQPVL